MTRDHGKPLPSDLAPLVVTTIHPSVVLRARDGVARDELYGGFVGDLKVVARGLTGS